MDAGSTRQVTQVKATGDLAEHIEQKLRNAIRKKLGENSKSIVKQPFLEWLDNLRGHSNDGLLVVSEKIPLVIHVNEITIAEKLFEIDVKPAIFTDDN